MTLVWGQGHRAQRNQASEATTSPSSNKFDNRNHKDSLGSNKPGPSEALARCSEVSAGPYEAFAVSLQTPSSKALEINVVWFMQKDLDQIIQSVFQA